MLVLESLEITWLISIILGTEKRFCDISLVASTRSFAAVVTAAAEATNETTYKKNEKESRMSFLTHLTLALSNANFEYSDDAFKLALAHGHLHTS